MTTRRTLPLLELDADLGQLLTAERLDLARAQLQVEVHRLQAGPWSAEQLHATNPEHVGLLLLDGVVAREVVVADTVSTELLGPGDVLRPWTLHDAEPLLLLEVRWNALTESRVAVLDRRFGSRLTQFPEVNSVLIDRLNDRAQRLATTQAISQLNRVDRRLLALFWHLAERWGRMTSDGLAVPLTLSHRMLGQLVGARRPTVSTAIGELAARDELVRRTDGTWLLKGDPVGLPTGEAQRIVPIRRKLLGQQLAEDPAGAVNGSQAAEPHAPAAAAESELISAAATELRTTFARLRSESESHEEHLREFALRTADLHRASIELREARRRQRDQRAERRRSRAPAAGT
jgi:CRP/FNR family transcriptional regulator, cyclic AMP receptor protein